MEERKIRTEKEREIEERKKKINYLIENKYEVESSVEENTNQGFHVLVETTGEPPSANAGNRNKSNERFKTFVWFEPTGDMTQDVELRIELMNHSRISSFGDGVSFVEMPDRFNIAVWGRDGALTLASAMREAANVIEKYFEIKADEIIESKPDGRMPIRGF